MIVRLTPLAGALLFATLSTAYADDAGNMFKFSGFGTVGLSKTSTDEAEFRTSYLTSTGTKKSADFGPDTKLGMQLEIAPTQGVVGTIQVLSQKNRDGNYTPEVEWANGKVAINSQLTARAGRIGAPVFMISDFRSVNYVNTWVRPPIDVYAQVPISFFDGVDLLWKQSVGDAFLTIQPYMGRSKAKVNFDMDVDLKNLQGINATLEYNSWSFRAGYTQGKITAHSPQLDQAFGTMHKVPVPAVQDTVSQLEAVDKKSSFWGLGATYDDGSWVAQSEYTQRKSDSFLSNSKAWYLSGGYRIGDFTPYVVTSKVTSEPNLVGVPLLSSPSPVLQALGKASMAVLSALNQHTNSVGVRWNAATNLAVKAQYDRISTDTGVGYGSIFTNRVNPNFQGSAVSVYSVSVDFLF
ncbi:hypothetical protein KSF73_11765 [Burkholderiaceae bacterium DAT-1]|nr:hypothetical protein [Burkholderiaceae bacterium DAT-1]